MSAQRQIKVQSEAAISPPPVVESDETRAIKHEVARYIAQMSNELGGMARGANMDLLAYFLDMCRVEANVQLERYDT